MAKSLASISKVKSLNGPILITGHTGFKGTWLTLLLEKLGIEFVGYSLPPEKESLFSKLDRKNKIQEEFGNILDLNQFEKFVSKTRPSVIMHLAAQPLVLKSYEEPLETFQVNALGTANILEIAQRNSNIKAFIAVTTDKVYRNRNNNNDFIESDPLEGNDPYSASKVAAEAAIKAWRKISELRGGPNIVSVRAGNVIGGGDWAENRLIPDLIRGFAEKQSVKIRNPNSTRPWQHVLDPLSGYILALEELLNGRAIDALNFGPTDISLSVSEVVELAQDVWPAKTTVEYLENSDQTESKYLGLNPEKSIQLLNWMPFWSQKDSVRKSIEWWVNVKMRSLPVEEACNVDIEEFLGNESKTESQGE